MKQKNEFEDLTAEVRFLEQSFSEDQRYLQSKNRTAIIVTCGVCALVSGFLFFNYFHLSSLWAQENFTQSLQQEMREISPRALEELQLLGEEVLPIYAEEGRRQLIELGPEIARRLQGELDGLSKDVVARVHEQLATSQERLMERCEAAVFESYPEVHDPQEHERLAKRLHEVLKETLSGTIVSFEDKFATDMERVRGLVFQFDVTDTNESKADLQKKFLRLWLQVLDQEIKEL